MTVIDAEKVIGLEVFLTKTKGIGGKLRTFAEDFVVKEQFSYPPHIEKGSYVIAEVTSKNWETNHLIRELSKHLHISRMRVGFAGTKDKRAWTTQLMSFANVSKDEVSSLHIKDVVIENVYLSNQSVSIGVLRGNDFSLVIRNVADDITTEHVQKIVSQINDYGGFPNFYGVQRFGIVRPITHIVGKYIVLGDFENAVMSYIAHPIKGEEEKIFQLRTRLEKTRDYADALQNYPDILSYEKAILNKLVINPEDYVGALSALPKNLMTMFVYAYQSYLFNRMLSMRLLKGFPIHEALIGDVILPIREKGVDEEGIMVTSSNQEKINQQIKKGNARVSSLLIGSDSQYSEGDMGKIEHSIIDSEKIDQRDFTIPKIPFLSSKGSRRCLLSPIKSLQWKFEHPTTHDSLVRLSFSLEKGCYATSLLREFMKSVDIRNY